MKQSAAFCMHLCDVLKLLFFLLNLYTFVSCILQINLNMQVLKKLLTPSLEWLVLPILISALLWFLPALFGVAYSQESYPFQLLGSFTWFTLPAGWAQVIQFVFQIVIGVILMQWCERWQLIPVRSAIPLFVALFLMSTIADLQFFDARTVALMLFLLAISQLFSMYSYNGEKVSAGFNIGFLVTSAAFFHIEYFYLIVIFLIGMIVFSTFTVRILFALLSGVFVPLFLAWSAFFLSDNLEMLFAILAQIHIDLFDVSTLELLRSDVLFAGILLLLFLMSLGSYFSVSLNFKLHVRLNFFFINLAFILTTIWAGFFFYKLEVLLFVPIIFLILLLSFFFSTNHSKFVNIIFCAFIVLGLAYRIINLLGF